MLKNIKGSFSLVDVSTQLSLLPNIIFIGVYTSVVYYIEYYIFRFDFMPGSTVFSLLGIVLGLLLVFRTNTAYERWWEGRKLWGQLLNSSRSLSIKLNAFVPEDNIKDREYFYQMISNYFFATKEHLRKGVKMEELEETEPGVLKDLENYQHVPNRIHSLIYQRINQLLSSKQISQEQLIVLDTQCNTMSDMVGGCERIKNTPIPTSYSKHLDRFVLLYTAILPFGFMHDLGWWGVPTIMIIYFALEGIKAIGEEIEDPFGKDANDLPIDQICENVKASLKEILIKPVVSN